jgi:hypothetical protein
MNLLYLSLSHTIHTKQAHSSVTELLKRKKFRLQSHELPSYDIQVATDEEGDEERVVAAVQTPKPNLQLARDYFNVRSKIKDALNDYMNVNVEDVEEEKDPADIIAEALNNLKRGKRGTVASKEATPPLPAAVLAAAPVEANRDDDDEGYFDRRDPSTWLNRRKHPAHPGQSQTERASSTPSLPRPPSSSGVLSGSPALVYPWRPRSADDIALEVAPTPSRDLSRAAEAPRPLPPVPDKSDKSSSKTAHTISHMHKQLGSSTPSHPMSRTPLTPPTWGSAPRTKPSRNR